MKNNKGITLIALVVTIIVLLILAAVSIAMLTGDNGILTNASKTSTENAYYGAEEQVKLAFMAVKTEIMAQVVKDGTYDARKETTGATNVQNLAKIVRADLNNSKWKVYYKGIVDPDTNDSDSDTTNDKAYIYITYSDSAIDQGAIETGKPKYEGKVAYTIVLNKQDAIIDYTTDNESGVDVNANTWTASGAWLENWTYNATAGGTAGINNVN